MNKAAFWKLIDGSRENSGGDLDEQVADLRARVEKLDPIEIVQFGKLFDEFWIRAYTWDLWAAAYILGGGCSDDSFLDFRGWLISRGERVYEEALRDSETLAQVVDAEDGDECKYEGFQYVAREAWQNKTRKRPGDFPASEVKQAREPAGEPWSEDGDDLKLRFPKLWRKFVEPPLREIRIVAAPPGEAPPAIRAAWIGCVLPLITGTDGPEFGGTSRGILSQKPVNAFAGYGVLAREAIMILEQHDAAAAEWWHEHAPHLLQPGKVLVFAADVCQLKE
jgi:hypothetical protein